MKRPLAIALWVSLIAASFLGLASWMGTPFIGERPGPEVVDKPELVYLDGAQSGFWPFLSSREVFEARSPVNVIMKGVDLAQALQVLRGTGWADVDADAVDADGGTYGLAGAAGNASDDPAGMPSGATWGDTVGADRMAFLHDGIKGRWVRQDAQVQDGSYFGHRVHLRLYESPVSGEWVIIQAHAEHFDWFTLRHSVDGVAGAQAHVEAGLMKNSAVKRVWRLFLDNGGPSGSDGWATVVEFRSGDGGASTQSDNGPGMSVGNPITLAIVGLVVARTRGGPASRLRAFVERHVTVVDQELARHIGKRLKWYHLALALSICAVVLGVRWLGLALESHVPSLPMHIIATIGYAVLILGLPAAAYGFSTRLEHRIDASLVASGSLGLAGLVDYGFLGVEVLPLPSIVHRAALVAIVGLIAAGAARRATRASRLNGLVVAGLIAWFTLVVVTVFG